jgi:hypothetical protein
MSLVSESLGFASKQVYHRSTSGLLTGHATPPVGSATKGEGPLKGTHLGRLLKLRPLKCRFPVPRKCFEVGNTRENMPEINLFVFHKGTASFMTAS